MYCTAKTRISRETREKEATKMNKIWLRGILLGVSLALLVAGGGAGARYDVRKRG